MLFRSIPIAFFHKRIEEQKDMTYKDIKHNEEVNELLKKGNRNLGLLGYTDHSQAHCVRVAVPLRTF